MTPYTTKSGVQIGIRYQQPKPGMYRDDELIQAALLGIQTPKVPSLAVIIVLLTACYLLVSCILKFK